MSLDLDATPGLEPPEKKGKAKKVKIGEEHQELIDWIVSKGCGEWQAEANRLVTHTAHLLDAHAELGLKGVFQTRATGKEGVAGRNCRCFPMPRGAWLVVRYGAKGPDDNSEVPEAETWWKSKDGNTVCYLNKSTSSNDPIEAIVELARKTYKFFHYSGDAYVEVVRRGNPEVLRINEDTFRRMLRIEITKHLKMVALQEWLKNALDQLAAHALEEGPEYPVYVRLAQHDKKVYFDLCDPQRTVIEVDGEGWRPCKSPPVRFYRTKTMKALPMPVEGGTIDDLKPFLNAGDDLELVVGVLVGFLNPDGPYAILQLIGADGNGKTNFALRIVGLIDPSAVLGCAPPKKVEDLMLAAKQRHVLFFDNLSEMPKWLSDAFCRLSTGGAIERRTLFKDGDTTAFVAKRPIILTGIPDIVESPDLVSRTIKIDLPRISQVMGEAELLERFEIASPKILGWLLSGVASAVKNKATTKIDNLPRLADFCIWAQAAEAGLGIEKGTVVAAYREARKAAVDDLLQTPLAQKVLTVKEFTGNMKDLLQHLGIAYEKDAEVKDYKDKLRTLVSTLQAQGMSIRFRRTHGKSLIEIKGPSKV
jgi:hypothetical protein